MELSVSRSPCSTRAEYRKRNPLPRNRMFERRQSVWTDSAKTGPATSRATAAGTRQTRNGRFAEAGDRLREVVQPDRIAVHEEVAAASLAVLGEMNQRASTVMDVNGRNPGTGPSKLKHAAACDHWIDDALAKPRAVAVDQAGEGCDNRQSGEHVSIETIERWREGTSPD